MRPSPRERARQSLPFFRRRKSEPSMSGVTLSERDLVTEDGHRIAARFYTPAGEPRGALLVVPAMGTRQEYYAAFATWAAAQGLVAATFDYRGTGRSRRGGLRRFKADIFDWARLDCGAMVAEVSAVVPGRPLYWVGHSLGGQILPFVPNGGRLSKALTIATGSGYWRYNTPPLNRIVWWLWYVVAPVSMALAGYFPGRRLRKVGDLPKGVMQQWRRWCLDPEYAVGAEGESARAAYAAVRTPIVSLSFTDDELMSARSIESIHGFYRSAPRTMMRIAPGDVGLGKIGHFGFFRAGNEEVLWKRHLLPELGASDPA
jgi:predicted alpha/beta hydrolase